MNGEHATYCVQEEKLLGDSEIFGRGIGREEIDEIAQRLGIGAVRVVPISTSETIAVFHGQTLFVSPLALTLTTVLHEFAHRLSESTDHGAQFRRAMATLIGHYDMGLAARYCLRFCRMAA